MDILYIATFMIAFFSSILSGMAGGGGGFVMAPYWIITGMTPAQGAATGAFMASGMSISSAAAFRNTGYFPRNKKLLYTLLVVAFLASIFGAVTVPKIDVQVFKYALAFITIAALPLLFLRPNLTHRLSRYRGWGLALAASLLVIGSIITSSAFSVLFALTLMAFFNMSVLKMTALRRLVGVVQSVVLFVALAAQGYFVWQHAIAGFIGGSVGSYIGTRYAVKNGESFARYALTMMSSVGAIALTI